jgi:hypothetical protein
LQLLLQALNVDSFLDAVSSVRDAHLLLAFTIDTSRSSPSENFQATLDDIHYSVAFLHST